MNTRALRSLLAGLLVFVMVFAMLPASAVGAFSDSLPGREDNGQSGGGDVVIDNEAVLNKVVGQDYYEDGDVVRVIVELEDKPLADISGTLKEGELTSKGLSHRKDMLAKHQAVEKQVRALKTHDGKDIKLRYDYTVLFNGLAFECEYGHLDEIRQIEGVKRAYVAGSYSLPTPQMNTSNDEVGSSMAWALGYDGEGMTVAVVDSGLDTDHDAFAVSPEKLALSREDLQNLLEQGGLNAQKRASFTVDDVYLSGKLPFVFDYAGSDTNVNHLGGTDHGTHVAGSAVGNPADGTISGVAPKAQLIVMKVFSDSDSSSSDDILAALEDCALLGVDVVNMSLGAPEGFAYRDDLVTTMAVYERLNKAGVNVAAAIGNDYSAAYKNLWELDKALTSNPDYGIVNSPASYLETMSIASVDNRFAESTYILVGERKILYTDTAINYEFDSQLHLILGGKTVQYAVIPGFGLAEDYEGIDVEGKIALVSRGDSTFAEKHAQAYAHKAAGLIVYDNAPGSLTNMGIEKYQGMPAAFISQSDGQHMLDSASDGVGTLSVSSDTIQVPNETGGIPSDFSSIGTTSGLQINPDLMAPGGNIYSSRANNSYGLNSGTSMATPHVAGAMAVVLQAIEEKYPAMSAEARMKLVNTLLMSTAGPAEDGDGTPYSPRKQGAGLMQVADAIMTGAYITVEGNDRPKLELGDDPQKRGVYTLNFKVVNTSGEALRYEIEPSVITELVDPEEYAYQGEPVYFIDQSPRDISGQCDITTNCENNIVTVPANGSADVSVVIKLNDEIKAELSDDFENGVYIEGFVSLSMLPTKEGAVGVDLNVPYLGFFGNWNEAPMIDEGTRWDLLNNDPCWASQTYNSAGSRISGTGYYSIFGSNPYADGVEVIPERNAISPGRPDGYFDKVDIIYTSLLRDARTLTYTISNSETGEVYHNETKEYVYKSVYDSRFDSIMGAGSYVESMMTPWAGTDSGGEMLPDGTKVIVKVDVELDYEGFSKEQNERTSWQFPVTIDNTAPQVVSSASNGTTLTVEVKDNQYVSYIELYDADDMGIFSEPIATQTVGETEAGKSSTFRFNVSGVNTVYFCVADYAHNEYIVQIDAQTGEMQTMTQFEYIVENDEVTITGYTGSDIDVAIPETIMEYPVTAIGDQAFQLESGIRSIAIGKNVRSIGNRAFSRCNALESINVDPENAHFASVDGVLFDKEIKTVLAYPGGKADTAYAIPEGVERVGDSAFFYATFSELTLPASLKEIADYGFFYCGGLGEVNFPAGLTTIGRQAFYGCNSLAAVSIHAGITQIGPAAFAYCVNLTGISVAGENPNYCSVDGVLFNKDKTTLMVHPARKGNSQYTVPDGVKIVDEYAFYDTDTLLTITIPDSVEAIGNYAFYYCDKATAISLGNGVKTIGDYAFYSCKALTELNLPDSLESIGKYAYAWCQGITSINTGNGVKTIGNYAFNYCSGLLSAVIGNGVETLGNYAFYSCTKLTDLTLGNNLRSIGSSAFNKCGKISAVSLPDTMETIGASAFKECSGIKTLSLGSGVKTIGNSAFMSCTGITKLVIPQSVTSIESNAFSRCGSVETLSLPGSVKEYGDTIFSYCTRLYEVVLPNGMKEIPNGMFLQCGGLTKVVIPESVTKIGDRAFNTCKKLAEVNLPSQLTRIGDSAFYYCQLLEDITIPDTVTYLGQNAYYNCTGLTSMKLGAGLETIGGFAFYGCSGITSMEIPDSVVSIGNSAFNRCNNMTEITFGKGLKDFGTMVFNYCDKLQRFIVDEENPHLSAVGGVLFDKDATLLMFYPQGKQDSTYTVPSTVTAIGDYGIYSIVTLEELILPDGLETLGDHSLSRNVNLKSLRLPKSLREIRDTTFYYGESMTAIDVDPQNETFSSIDGVLFNKAQDTLLFYPNGRPDAMYVVPDGVKNLRSNSFYECKTIEGIDYNNVEFIGEYSMYRCSNLKTVKMGDSVQSVDANAFAYCSSITTITETAALKNIGANAFTNCSKVRFIFLPNAELIGEYAFNNCSAITRVVLGSNLKTVMNYAFTGSKALTQAYFLGNIPETYGANVFRNAHASFTVYYDGENVSSWAPDGETTFDGRPLVGTTFHRVQHLDVNGRTLLDQVVADGLAAIVPEALEREGHPFIGWSQDASSVTEDMVITAEYEGISGTVTISASAGEGGSITPEGNTNVTYEGDVTFKITPDEGYRVADVIVDGESVGAVSGYTFENVTEPHSIEAVFELKTYSVKFLDWDGWLLSEQTIEHGKDADAPRTPERTGYTFTGWDAQYTNVTSDLTINAQYEADTFTVTFLDWDGEELSAVTVGYGQNAEPPEDPEREGHTFAGWIGDFTEVTENRTIYARYEINAYTVRFLDWDGEELSVQTVGHGYAANEPAEPEREGYVFTGWDAQFSSITADTDVNAQYERLVYTVRYFDAVEGEVFHEEKVAYGANGTYPEAPSHDGYTFTGWAGDCVENVTGDRFAVAMYEKDEPAQTYTVFFIDTVLNELIDSRTVTEGEDATPPEAPEHEGYRFLGWNGDYTGVTEDRVIFAQYEANTYTVQFFDWDGELINEQTVAHGYAAELPETPVREGHTFTGWIGEGDYMNVTEDMSFTAQYAVNSYTVKFVDWDGMVISEQTVEHGRDAEAPAAPPREGYTFTEWYGTYTNVTSDSIVYARYAINTYTVQFIDWDGTVLNAQEVAHGYAAAAPEAPQREGYAFVGWDKEFSRVVFDMQINALYEEETQDPTPTPVQPTPTPLQPTPTPTLEPGPEDPDDPPKAGGISLAIAGAAAISLGAVIFISRKKKS